MTNRARAALRDERGFTLIELLVVILIIGILAAIAIPSFLNQKGKGEDAQTKSNARQAQTAIETWYTDNGNYNASVAQLQAIEPTVPAATTLSNLSSTTYTIRVTGTNTHWF